MAQPAMSPENLETRIVRLETRGERWDLTVPLLGEVAVMDERVDGLKEDLNEGLRAIRLELADIKRDSVSRAKERRAMLLALILAGAGLVGNYSLQLLQIRGGK